MSPLLSSIPVRRANALMQTPVHPLYVMACAMANERLRQEELRREARLRSWVAERVRQIAESN